MPVVFLPRQIAPEGVDYLTARGYTLKYASAMDEDTLAKEIVGCDAMLLRTAHATRKVLAAEPRLKIVARHGVGLDIIDVEAATELGIQVTNTPSSNGISVAEYAICGMMAVARKLFPLSEAAKRGDFFYKNHCQGSELSGKTLGLVGMGFIGSQVAKIAALGFGMKVLAYSGHTKGKAIPDYVTLADWDTVFSTSDFISVHIPLRPENIGLIGAKEFSQMKTSAIFVNTARGKVVREEDLIEALRTHQIAGAFLDVFAQEPMTPDHPLLHMEQVVATPHCGASTNEALIRSAVNAAMEIDRFFQGEPLLWPVNQVFRAP